MTKKLKSRATVSKGKIGAAKASTGSTQDLKPVFSFEYMQDGHHCIDGCQKNNPTNPYSVLQRIRRLSSMTWDDIQASPRHGLGSEKIPRKRIKEPIPPNITEDVSSFLSLRCIGKAPMIGFRDGQTFHIIWIDYDFSVYDHG